MLRCTLRTTLPNTLHLTQATAGGGASRLSVKPSFDPLPTVNRADIKRNAFKASCKALASFSDTTMFHHPESSVSLVANLLEAASELNATNSEGAKATTTLVDRTQWKVGGAAQQEEERGGERGARLRPIQQSHRQSQRKKESQWKEPWHGGKPGAYVSPMLFTRWRSKTRQGWREGSQRRLRRRGSSKRVRDHERLGLRSKQGRRSRRSITGFALTWKAWKDG